MTLSDIETRIQTRSYQTPGRARASINRSSLPPRHKTRLTELVEVWENEAQAAPVVGGVPETASSQPEATLDHIVDADLLEPGAIGGHLSVLHSTKLDRPLIINLNAAIRARLTPYGVAVLWGARDKVQVPENLMETGGVWETTLAFFMIAMGSHLDTGGLSNESPTVAFRIELLDPRV